MDWCSKQHQLSLEHASPKVTQTGEPKYNLESGKLSTEVEIDYTKMQNRLNALTDARVKTESLSYLADANVGKQLDALRESVPSL